MAAPIGNQPPPLVPQQPVEQARPAAPGGNGAAQTTMQTAAAPAAPVKGYIETVVIYIRDTIVWLISKIFCCFTKAEVPPAPQPQPQAPEIPQLLDGVKQDIDLLNAFRRLPEMAQNRIYVKIGQERGLYYLRRGDDLTFGKNKVQEDPQVLLNYIVLPNQ